MVNSCGTNCSPTTSPMASRPHMPRARARGCWQPRGLGGCAAWYASAFLVLMVRRRLALTIRSLRLESFRFLGDFFLRARRGVRVVNASVVIFTFQLSSVLHFLVDVHASCAAPIEFLLDA